MGTEIAVTKKRAPTLYVIIAIKILKGLLFVALAVVIYCLSDNDLPSDFQHWLRVLRFNPERRFWVDVGRQIGQLTETNVLWAAGGTLLYSLFSLVEGVGLMFRVPWAGWMAIGESAFFIPIEIFELVQGAARIHNGQKAHPVMLLIILAINIFIVWYLFQNRKRLFKHHSSEIT